MKRLILFLSVVGMAGLASPAFASRASYLGDLPVSSPVVAEFFTLMGNYYCSVAKKYGHNDASRKALQEYGQKLDPGSSPQSAWEVAGLVQKKAKKHLCP